jgi:hypothetical protein
LQQRHNLAESMRKLQVTRNCKIALQNLANLILEILSILESIQCLGNISRATRYDRLATLHQSTAKFQARTRLG